MPGLSVGDSNREMAFEHWGDRGNASIPGLFCAPPSAILQPNWNGEGSAA